MTSRSSRIKKQSRKTRKGEDEDIEFGPFSIRRRGSRVEFEGHASPAEAAAIRDRFHKWRSEAPTDLRREADQCLNAIRHIDPIAVLGTVFFRNHIAPQLGDKKRTRWRPMP